MTTLLAPQSPMCAIKPEICASGPHRTPPGCGPPDCRPNQPTNHPTIQTSKRQTNQADNKAPADGGPPDQVEFSEDRGFLLSGAPLFLDPKMEQAASGGLTEKNVPDVAATLATPEKARILLQVLVISKQRKPWPIPTRCQRYQLRTNHLRQAGELCSAQQYVVGGHMRCQGLIATEGPVATESSRQILMRTSPKMKDQMRFTYLYTQLTSSHLRFLPIKQIATLQLSSASW